MMKTKLLEATCEDLERLLGEVLQPEVKHHICNAASHRCKICDMKLYTYSGRGTKALQEECIAPTPIPLTWPNAMKWRDWSVKNFGRDAFNINLLRVFGWTYADNRNVEIKANIIADAKPEHYLQAAALCVLYDKESE